MVLNFRLQALHILFLKDFYGVTNAPRDNGGSSNYEEKNNGMKVYSSHFLYWVLEGKKTTRSWFGNFSILPKWHFWTCAWNSNFFWPKAFFWSIMKMATRKNIHNLSKGPPNPGFMQEKVQKGDFLKKDSRELKFFSCFRFLWISQRPGTLNWERVVFLPSKNLYRKCDATCIHFNGISFHTTVAKFKYNITVAKAVIYPEF